MPTIRVDETSTPPEERTFHSDLEALFPDYEIRITLQESEWLPLSVEHIKVFIQSPLGVALITALSKQIGASFLELVKKQRSKRPKQPRKKLTIYGPDGKTVKNITVEGDDVDEE